MRRIIAIAASSALVGALALTAGQADPAGWKITKVTGSKTEITEPGINISSDGTIYVDGPAGTPGRSQLFRSKDGGDKFEKMNFGPVQSRFPGGGDSDVATRGDRIYFLDLYLGSNSISVSEDAGATWLTGNPFTTLPTSDRQWIALGDRDPITEMDTVYALYAQTEGVMLARSRTGGITWESHGFVPAINTASGFTGQLESDGSKTLAFAWEDRGELKSAVSTDEGDTWTMGTIASNVLSIIPGIAMTGSDLYAAWIDRTDYSLHVAASHNLGDTWGGDTTLAAGRPSNIFPWIDAHGGKVAVAWYGATVPDGTPEQLEPTVSDDVPDSTQWKVFYSESLDSGATYSPPLDVAFGYKSFICTRGLSCDPTLGGKGHRELGDFLTTTIREDGKTFIVFGGQGVAGPIRVARQI